MDFQIVTKVITFFLDAYQQALDTLPVISVWLKWLVSPNALVWYVLGLLTLTLYQKIRIRFGFRRMKSRLVRKVKGRPRRLISFATWTLAKACPKAPIEIRKEEVENILNVLSKAIEIASRIPVTDWKKVGAQVDSSWLGYFFSKCRMIEEPTLQQAFAEAFVYEANTRGRLDHRHIDLLAGMSIQDWRTFTVICDFACSIEGRITPVVFNYEDDVYKKAGLDAEDLDSLIAAGLVTQGGTGDSYTLKMPKQGLRVRYFDEEEFIVRPLSEPIPRSALGRMVTRPNPLDTRLNVGVVDFTDAGLALGSLTPRSKIDGFAEHLRCQWKEYLQEENSIS